MNTLQNKIDFAVIFRVTNANPNGDPLNGNRPRTDYSNYGEMSDVSIKRKIRDRLLELGASSFHCAVLVEKVLKTKKPIAADFVGLTIPDRFVFGCGMDAKGYWRNLPEIRAMKGT